MQSRSRTPGAALGGKQSEIVGINLYKRGDCLKVIQFFHVTKEREKKSKKALLKLGRRPGSHI